MRRALALSILAHVALVLAGVGAGYVSLGRQRREPPPGATAEMIFVDPGEGQPGAAPTPPKPAPPTSAPPQPAPPAPSPAPSSLAAAAPTQTAPSPLAPTPASSEPLASEPPPVAPDTRAAAAPPPEVRLGDSDAAGSTSEVEGGDIPAGPDPAAPNIPPRYPTDAVRHGEEGVVVLEVAVAPDGGATAVGVYSSSGFGVLDRAARDAVARWRFRPRLDAGEPIASRTLIRVRFRLD